MLDTLHRKVTGPFGSVEAAESLGLSRRRASRLHAYLAKRGWRARVRRGPFDPQRDGLIGKIEEQLQRLFTLSVYLRYAGF